MQLLDKDLQSIQEVRNKLDLASQAQDELNLFSQKKLNTIILAMSKAAYHAAEELAILAKEETGFGIVEDKILKNQFAAQKVYESIKDEKIIGLIDDDSADVHRRIGVPVGVIAGLIPSTNPTSTVIYKALIALKAGNAIVFSPHPKAKKCILKTVQILREAAVRSGAPEGSINCLENLSLQGTQELMKHAKTKLILATDGEAMVKSAYSSGTPALGVGPGNGPVYIEKTADLKIAAEMIVESRSFDNGVICASEQSVVIERSVEKAFHRHFEEQGAYFMTAKESQELAKFMLRENKTINPKIVGKSALEIAHMLSWSIPTTTKVLVSCLQKEEIAFENPYAREKLAPIMGYLIVSDEKEAKEVCQSLLQNEGKGHTMTIHSNDKNVIERFAMTQEVSRFLVNSPAALGGIGATTTLTPALTLGCGAVGGSATSDNVTAKHLRNIRYVSWGNARLSNLKTKQTTDSKSLTAKDFEQLIDEIIRTTMASFLEKRC